MTEKTNASPEKVEAPPPEKKAKMLFVGKRPVGAYVMLAKTFLSSEEEILLAARGKLISKLVIVAEILKRNRFSVKEMSISSDQMTNRAGKSVYVAIMTITLTKKKAAA